METVIVLVVIGVLLAGVEVFVPGGILGILSALFLIVATVLAYRELGTYGAIGVVGGSVILVIIVVLIIIYFCHYSRYFIVFQRFVSSFYCY